MAWRKLARSDQRPPPLLMELPAYRWPSLRSLALGLYERAVIFLKRVGGIILAVTILLWFLSTLPRPAGGRHRGGHHLQLCGPVGPPAGGAGGAHWL